MNIDLSIPIRNQHGVPAPLGEFITLIKQHLDDRVHLPTIDAVFEQVWREAFQAGRNQASCEYRKTLRDEFALAVLSSWDGVFRVGRDSEFVYEVADSMLAARECGGDL